MKNYSIKLLIATVFFLLGAGSMALIAEHYAKEQAKAARFMASQFYEKGEKESAIALLNQSIGKDPGHYSPFHILGNIYQEKGNTKYALKMYELALERAGKTGKVEKHDRQQIETAIKKLKSVGMTGVINSSIN